MGKTFVGLYLSPETAERLREVAMQAGLTNSDLGDLSLRYAMEHLTLEQVKAWGAKQPSKRGRLGGAHTKAERMILAAFESLAEREQGAWRFSAAALANEAGLRLTEGLLALKRLRQRGETMGTELDEVDRWGRPVKSFWSLSQRKP